MSGTFVGSRLASTADHTSEPGPLLVGPGGLICNSKLRKVPLRGFAAQSGCGHCPPQSLMFSHLACLRRRAMRRSRTMASMRKATHGATTAMSHWGIMAARG